MFIFSESIKIEYSHKFLTCRLSVILLLLQVNKNTQMRIQLLTFLMLIFINYIVDLYIYYRVICAWCNRRWMKWSFWTTNVLILGMVLVSVNAIKSGYNERWDYLLFWFLFLYFALYMPRLIFFVISLFDYLPLLFRHKITRWGSKVALVISFIAFVTMLSGAFYGRLHPVINEVEVVSDTLPGAFDGYRIIQISDLHLSSFGTDTAFVSQIVNQVNELRPDMIVFTGDLVSRRADEADAFTTVLSRFQAGDVVWSIMGNHDYGDYVNWNTPEQKIKNLSDIKRMQTDAGWKMLNNASTFIFRGNDSIALIGVENWGEPPFPQYGNLKVAYTNLNDNNYKILLTHNPIHWDKEVVPETNIDLSLSGHTHAMQMKVKIGRWQVSPSSLRYPRWSGLYREGNQYLYVNEGIGCVFYPMRIGARPEITVLTLKSK